MKNNKNPLFVTEWMAPSLDVLGGAGGPSNAWETGLSYSLGVGSKWLKDLRLIKKIKAKYPNPQTLAEKVMRINTPAAKQFGAKLAACTDDAEYTTLLKKYVCHSTFGRYFIHALFGSTAAVGNAVDAGANELNDVDSTITKNLV